MFVPLRSSSIVLRWWSLCLWPIPAVAVAAPPQAVTEHGKATTVLIDREERGSGSGFCVRGDGLFLTNAHVVADLEPDEGVRLVLSPGEEHQRVVTAKVVSLDEENDLALLRTDEKLDHPALTLGDASKLTETMGAVTLGYPFGRLLAVGEGEYPSISVNLTRISALRKEVGRLRAIQLDGSVNPGHSGGPVIDDEGRLVGVIVAGVPGANLSFAIPITTVKEFLDRPGMILTHPPLRFSERGKPVEFRVEIVSFDLRRQPDEVELRLPAEGIFPRRVTARKSGQGFIAEAPLLDVARPETICLAAWIDSEPQLLKVNGESPFRIGNRELAWIDVRKIERLAAAGGLLGASTPERSVGWSGSSPRTPRGDETHIVVTTSGKKYAGTLAGLEGVEAGDSLPFDLEQAERIDVFVTDPVPEFVSVTVEAGLKGEVISRIEQPVVFDGVPAFVDPEWIDEGPTEAPSEEETIARRKRNELMQLRQRLEADLQAWLDDEDRLSTDWQTLEPTSFTASGGAEMQRQEDGSIFVDSGDPKEDVYTLTMKLPVPLSGLTGVMVELLQDSHLPENGPGRARNGNTFVTGIRISSLSSDGTETPVVISRVRASDFMTTSQSRAEGWRPYEMLDGDPQTGWGATAGRDYAAVLEFDLRQSLPSQSRARELKFVFEHRGESSMGRFRISSTASPHPLAPRHLREPFLQLLAQYDQGLLLPYDERFVDYFAGGSRPFNDLVREVRELPTPAEPERSSLRTALSRIPDSYAPQLDELIIEANVPQATRLLLLPRGLLWDHDEGRKPGLVDSRGYYVNVNGQRWDLQWQSSSGAGAFDDRSYPFLVHLGPAAWTMEVLSVNGDVSRRGGVSLKQESDSAVLEFENATGATVKYLLRLTKVGTAPSRGGASTADGIDPDLLAVLPITEDLLNRELVAAEGATVPVTSSREQGYLVGPVPRGSKLTFQYVRGKWKGFGRIPSDNPDTVSADRSRLVIAATSRITGRTSVLAIVPKETAKTPFVWEAPADLDRVVLRINDSDDIYADHPDGGVQYQVKLELPTEQQ